MRYPMFYLIVLPLAFTACGDDPKSSDASDSISNADGDTSTSETGSDTAGDVIINDSVFASLLGEWVVPCRIAGGPYYHVGHLKVTPTSIENTNTQYLGDPTCSDESKKINTIYVEDSAWNIGAPFGEGLELDMVLREATVAIIDETVKTIWERESGCGPFEVGQVKDVSGMSCYGFWRPEVGATYYTIISIQGDTFYFGAPASGDMRTEATRSTVLDRGGVWQRVGATPGSGFIEGTIAGETYRAEKNTAARLVQREHIQIGATTEAVTPWETWIINVPNEAGTYSCEDASINAYLNFGFTEANLPVLWDTEKSGGADCIISITKAAPAVGDTIEGTFGGTLGDGSGTGHDATEGSFSIVRVQ